MEVVAHGHVLDAISHTLIWVSSISATRRAWRHCPTIFYARYFDSTYLSQRYFGSCIWASASMTLNCLHIAWAPPRLDMNWRYSILSDGVKLAPACFPNVSAEPDDRNGVLEHGKTKPVV